MMPLSLLLIAIAACLAAAEQPNKSLKELEQILKNLAAHTAPKNRAKSFVYIPHNSRPESVQRTQNREESSLNDDSAQSMEFYRQNVNGIQKQLEDDVQQALMFENDRICKATGRCGCSTGRCGKDRSVDRTVAEMDQLLKVLNKDLNRQQYGHFQSDNDRRERYNKKRGKHGNPRQQYQNRQQNDRQEYEDRRQTQNDREQKYGDRRQRQQRQDDSMQENEERRQRQDDRRQKQQEGDRQQEYDEADEVDTDQNSGITAKKFKNADFDIIILDVPQPNEFQDRANDLRVVDVREADIKDLIQQQQQQKSYDKQEAKDRRAGNLNLEEFVTYYQKIKNDMASGLSKYVKGLGSSSYLTKLLPYQKSHIEHLKNLQSKTPLADKDVKAKIVQLLFGSLSNIKILPHSKDSQTIYIPQQVINAIPAVNRQKIVRTNKRVFPLTFFQKQRQRNLVPKNMILKHSWRRNNDQQQQQKYGVPFNLQVQGLGQVNEDHHI